MTSTTSSKPQPARKPSADASQGLINRVGTPVEQTSQTSDLLLFGQGRRVMAWPWPAPATRSRAPRSRGNDPRQRGGAAELRARGPRLANLPDFLVEADLEAGRLVSIRCQAVETLEVHALHPDRRLLPARVRLCIDTLVEVAPSTCLRGGALDGGSADRLASWFDGMHHP